MLSAKLPSKKTDSTYLSTSYVPTASLILSVTTIFANLIGKMIFHLFSLINSEAQLLKYMFICHLKFFIEMIQFLWALYILNVSVFYAYVNVFSKCYLTFKFLVIFPLKKFKIHLTTF